MAWTLPIVIALAVLALLALPPWLVGLHKRGQLRRADERILQARQEAQDLRRELDELQEGMVDGLLVADVASLRFLRVNSAACAMLGYDRAELLQMGVDRIHPPDCLSQVRDLFQQQARGLLTTAMDVPCQRKDGSVFYADIAARQARIDGRRCLVGVFRDVSQRRAMQEELKQSQLRYASLVEHTADGYFVADFPDGRFVFLNRRIREIFGYGQDEGLGLTLWDVLPPEDHRRAAERFARLDGGGREQDMAGPGVYTGVRKDGSRFLLEVTSTLVSFEGRPAVRGLVRDVTEREAVQRQLVHAQKMQAIGTLAGGVAHEFNNILMALRGYLQLLRMRLAGQGEALGYVDKMDQGCQRAAALTNKMLTLTRLESGRRQAVNVNQVVEEVQRLLTQTLPPGIEVAAELEMGLPAVQSDPGQLEQVLINLCLNARDALPQGGRITLRTRLVRPAGAPGDRGHLALEVQDNGAGMPSEVLERVFEPFFTTKDPGQGTGLGLSIAYSLIKAQGGEIAASSQPGQGSVFTIRLPLADAPAPAQRPAGRRDGETPLGHGQRVLVVDDEPDVREVIRTGLEANGYQVSEAGDGAQGLAAIARADADGRPVDLVLLDLAMPVLDGQGLLRRLAAARPHSRVLVVTGQAAQVPAEAQDMVAGVLNKPFSLEALLRRVAEALNLTPPAPRPTQNGSPSGR
ncbi:MAG: PAS domain S-box protein [Thermodesulfobacteriota bacterium]